MPGADCRDKARLGQIHLGYYPLPYIARRQNKAAPRGLDSSKVSRMKYLIIVPDGMSDTPSDFEGGRTPLVAADTPAMDRLADHSRLFQVKTVPDGMHPGSDVAGMSLFGANPRASYTGRSPLECAAKGVDVGDGVAYRCNLVTIEDGKMRDFTAGHIPTGEADACIQSVNEALRGDGRSFHTGVSYRHAMLAPIDWLEAKCTPPHDISDQAIDGHLPSGKNASRLNDLMDRSRAVLADHPVSRDRIGRGELPATQVWLWGQGTKPSLPSLRERFGLDGGVITAVDLIRGIGRLVGMEVVDVEGATGFTDTNYEGKADAALDVLRRKNFAYVHVEAPDECGHMGDVALKTQAIHDFDHRMLARLISGLETDPALQPFRVVLLPDHPTPCALRTHSSDPVPALLYDSRAAERRRTLGFGEEVAIQEAGETLAGHDVVRLLTSA